ncbi:MAG: YXWGXW repeat-containing protein [Deltaproteobacteria bacterium]|nr:YXWGXW repeat-containing protein [Deltaproteobacteria bacterium]
MRRLLGALLVLSAGWALACDRGDRGPANADDRATEEGPDTEQPADEAEPAPEAPALDPRPAAASPTEPVRGQPPHPAIPPPIEEAQPSSNTLASTTYRWLPGHWIWTGNQYEWQPGLWVYDLPGYVMLSPQWIWDGDYWTFRDAGWATPGTNRAVFRPSALPDGSSQVAPAPDSNEAQVDLEVRVSSYAVYAWPGAWVAPPIVYPPNAAGTPAASRYARRIKASDPDAAPAADADVTPARPDEPPIAAPHIVLQAAQPDANEADDEKVEYVPGVLHGGKRGEEELRLMQEAQEREAAEQTQGVDAVYVPYYWSYPPYYPARPGRPHPPRPAPLPGRPPPVRAPTPRPR